MDDRSPLRRLTEEAGDPHLFPPEVHALYEAGKPHEALQALRAQIAVERNDTRKQRQQQHADNLYLWARPSDPPGLFTLNGIGTRLLGRHAPDEDGTYISTVWFTLVFLPIWPISSWVVRDAPGGGYHFFARAPLPPFARAARWAAAGLTVLGIVGAEAASYYNRTQAELMLYNGHAVPVLVRVGEEELVVPPHEHLSAGRYSAATPLPVSARLEDGASLDEQTLDLTEAGGATAVWNINQRGVLVHELICFGTADHTDDPPKPALGAPSLHVEREADYVLHTGPDEVRLRNGQQHVDHLALLAIGQDSSVSDTAQYLIDHGFTEHAAALIAAELEVNLTDGDALRALGTLLPPDTQRSITSTLRERSPDDVSAHRAYQDAQADNLEPLVQEYTALRDAHPDAPMYHYLLGRVLPTHDPGALLAYEAALRLDAGYMPARSAVAYSQLTRHEVDQAVKSYALVPTDDPVLAYAASPRVRALRVAHGVWWNDAIAAVIDGLGADDLWGKGHRTYLQVAAGLRTADQAVAELATNDREADPTSVEARSFRAFLLYSAGDLQAARAAVLDLGDDAAPRLSLLLALTEGGSAIDRLLNERADHLLNLDPNLTLLAAVAAQRRGHPSAEALLERARTAPTSAMLALAPGADLSTTSALDALMQTIEPENKPFAYAAVALSLGEGPVAAYARQRAAAWSMPYELPAW